MSSELAERLIEERTRQADVMQRLWAKAMPTAEMPLPDQFYLWARLHDLDAMLCAIDKVARKRLSLHGNMDLDYLVRYASKVANGITYSKQQEQAA